MSSKYQDILYLKHHQSKTHKTMSIMDRAAQFSPFAALTGYDDKIEETNRFRQEKIELGEYDLEELNEKIHVLMEHTNLPIEIVYYDEVSQTYQSKIGTVKRIDSFLRTIEFRDRTKISLEDIFSIELR